MESRTSAGNSPLTESQAEVVSLAPDTRALVTAGAGTGKTHVLIARLAHLIDCYELSPGGELLVLSFSRAAVREVRTRLAQSGSSVRYVGVVTFDSFATRLLSMVDPEGSWIDKDYDGRIRDATRLLSTNTEAAEYMSNYRHVMVDEIQDLVAERDEMVRAVLRSVQGGFTLFGDPAQGIYTWQLEEELRAVGAGALYAWLLDEFPGLDRFEFSENHRALTAVARTALWAGPELNAPDPDYASIRYRLETDRMRLRTGTLDHYHALLQCPGMSTAILCRTNGQALTISRNLHARSVSHCLQRRAVDRALPTWIALVLGDTKRKRIGKRAFQARMVERLGDSGPEPDEAWRTLKRMDPGAMDILDIGAVALRIRSSYVPDELIEFPKAELTVSTVHRAKGLEFDRILVTDLDPIITTENGLQLAEETRVLYVALTRARRELFHLQSPDTKGVRWHGSTDRWVRRGFGRRSWQFYDFEVRGDDIHREDPAGGFLCRDRPPQRTQEYIRDNVKSGDPVRLLQISAAAMGSPRAFYAVVHEGRVVGVTSENFARLLYQTLKIGPDWKVKWPLAIEDLNVEGVDTVAGTEAAGMSSGLGPSALWLRVRVAGLGRLVFV